MSLPEVLRRSHRLPRAQVHGGPLIITAKVTQSHPAPIGIGRMAVMTSALTAKEYLFGYTWRVNAEELLTYVRQESGLSQGALAVRAGTSRPTLSAYEHGHKSPTLDTASRILSAAGFELEASPRVDFVEAGVNRGRPIMVPTSLPRLGLQEAFATVELPLHLNWSDRGRRFNLRNRRQRARVYEIVLREGGPADVLRYVDGALLVDLWDELVLATVVRAAWSPVVTPRVAVPVS